MGELGEQLRAAREAQRLTLAEVARRTHVAEGHLAALERGDYAALPPRVYVEGMVRVYSACVGLDPEAMVRRLDGALGPPDVPGVYPHLRAMQHRGPGFPRSFTAVAVVVVLLVLVGLALLLWQVEAVPAAGDAVPPASGLQVPSARGVPAPATVEELLLLRRMGLSRGAPRG